jgi:hypothetical protein
VPSGIGAFLYSKNINLLLIGKLNYGYICVSQKGHGSLGRLTVKHQKAREGGVVKGTWNKWLVRERLAGLCRESPFIVLASEATFAVTDDRLNQVRRPGRDRRMQAASLLNIIEL